MRLLDVDHGIDWRIAVTDDLLTVVFNNSALYSENCRKNCTPVKTTRQLHGVVTVLSRIGLNKVLICHTNGNTPHTYPRRCGTLWKDSCV